MERHVEKVFAQNWIEQLKDANERTPYFTGITGLIPCMNGYDTVFIEACINSRVFAYDGNWDRRERDIRTGMLVTR